MTTELGCVFTHFEITLDVTQQWNVQNCSRNQQQERSDKDEHSHDNRKQQHGSDDRAFPV